MSSTLKERGSRAPGFLPPDPRVEEPYRITPQLAVRIAVLGVLAIIIFCALFFRLWALQVISGERYLEDAENNQIRSFRLPAPRGSIVDRDGTVLVSNTPGTLIQIWPAALEDMPVVERDQMLRRLSRLLGVRFKTVRERLEQRLESDPLTPVTIRSDVGDLRAAYLMEHQGDFPGVQIAETYLRRFEGGGIGAHFLGYVAEIGPEQLEARVKEGYAAGDRIGQTGVEAAYDTYLRGLTGLGRVYVDAMGRITSEREFSQLPEPGDNIRLTIDAELQRAAEEALAYGIRLARDQGEWAADGGALVAMDPHTGEILALASNPTFDPSIYVGTVKEKDLKELAHPRANLPTLNRAVAGVYPPASTFKPFTALAALQEGMLRPDELIQCSPSMEIDGQTFANWDPYKDEPMQLTTALANSCDTYFYDVALRFYERPDSPFQRWLRNMGFGGFTGIDIGPEEAGLVPTPAWRRKTFETEIDKIWTSGDSVQLSIGQGDMLVTPLQMTRAYAMIANGGQLVEPHIVKSVEEPRNEGEAPVVLRPYTPKPPQDIGLDPYALRIVQQGLYEATHATYGTAQSVFGAFPIRIAGKTGTAEKFVRLPGFQGLRDQSWFCGYGPYEKPEIVACALIENGGHGGEAAAPVTLKVFEEYFGVDPESYSATIQRSD
ncbi:MAG TPA: penicillin-binding protein 2 [Gaiellaceae bacterium]|nr:penicillin-binding protein 2 [Gaiellaceae bacterium]